MKRTFEEHLDPAITPKRILALDGGGIRGALTLGYLQKVERILRDQYGEDYLLSDHFDLIGGTSTGAIIAAALATGKSVKQITKLYMDLGGEIFGEKRNAWNPLETIDYLKAKYNYTALEKGLQSAFGTHIMGSDLIKTGLCIVAKRADTNSVWPIINHPGGKYYDSKHGKNKNIPIWQAVRASTAAPTYFIPQKLDVGNGEVGAFVDGGLSMSNNPALRLLMVATLQGFPFKWKMEEDKLSLLSLGTGYHNFTKPVGAFDNAWKLTWAQNAPEMLMQDANWENQLLLQWMSSSKTAARIDGEVSDLSGDLLSGKALIKYLRYNFEITENDLNGLNLGRNFGSKDVKDLIEMSNAHNRELLYQIGAADAKRIATDDILTL